MNFFNAAIVGIEQIPKMAAFETSCNTVNGAPAKMAMRTGTWKTDA
jgi:hypothetical protein